MTKHKSLEEEATLAEEAVLVRRTTEGDANALSELYERYVDKIYGFFSRRVMSRSMTESLTSETFVRAITAIMQGRYISQGKTFGAWLFAIAANVLHEQTRELKQESLTVGMSDLPEFMHPTTEEEGVLDSVIQQEEGDILWHLVDRLPPAQKKVIVMRYRNNMSYAEIAKHLKRTEDACKQLHYRALQSLKHMAREAGMAL